MTSAQNPARNTVRNQKDDSLLAIKEWLVRDGRNTKPEADSGLNDSADSDRHDTHSADNKRPADGDRHDVQEEIHDAPSIAAVSGFLTGLSPKRTGLEDKKVADDYAVSRAMEAAGDYANAAATERPGDFSLVQSTEIRTGRPAIQKPLAHTIARALLVAVIAAFALVMFPYGERNQTDMLSAWNQLKDWSVNEFHAAFSQKDTGAVSERTDAAAQDGNPSSATDRLPSPEMRQQVDTMSADLSALQGAALRTWNGLKDWSVNEFHAAFSQKDTGTVSERTDAAAQDINPSSATDRSSSHEMRQQLDPMSADWSALQTTLLRNWNRLKDWSSNEFRAASNQDAGTPSEHSEAIGQGAASLPASGDAQSRTAAQSPSSVQSPLAAPSPTSAQSPLAAPSPTSAQTSLTAQPSAATHSPLATPSSAAAQSRIAAQSPAADQSALATDRSSLSELQHQLDTLSANLTLLQSTVSQLGTRQAQIARDIATLQTTEQNISEKLSVSALPRSARRHAPHRAN